MDKNTMEQYRALQREIPKLKKDIEKLYARLKDTPTVAGKVTKSGDNFPYIEEHMTVEMPEPKRVAEIRKQIRYRELRLNKAERDKTAIEQLIAGIGSSKDRQILELYFIDGMKQEKVARTVGYSKGRISQIIYKYLKD